MKQRNKSDLLASIIAIFTNLLIFFIIFISGYLSNSMSIKADAYHTLLDSITAIIGLFGIYLSKKKPDKNHPYGYEKIEYITSLIIGVLIIALGFKLGIASIINRHDNTFEKLGVLSFILLITSFIIKFILFLYLYVVGKKTKSLNIIATSRDCFNDIIATFSIIITNIIICFVNISFNIDSIISLIISIIIINSGYKTLKESIDPLISPNVDENVINNIILNTKKYDIVKGIHDVKYHSYGKHNIYMSMHIEFDASISYMLIHDLIDDIERDVKKNYNIDLCIHADPMDLSCSESNKLYELIKSLIIKYDKDIKMSDFRVTKGNVNKNIIFDVYSKNNIKKEDFEKFLLNNINQDNIYLVINYEVEYI